MILQIGLKVLVKLTLNRAETISSLSARDNSSGCQWLNCSYEINEENPITIEHILPRSFGGTDDLENLELLCQTHNYYRANRLYINKELRILEPIDKKCKPQRVKHPEPTQCCNEGRNLGANEVCSTCGLKPQPQPFPRFLKRELKDCDHAFFHCWACGSGIYERQQVIMNLMVGD